ncbi:peptide methionine sulfoxide reductase-like [Oppia nitens]|uniref:peptide methionine sulfoxide reductase-like n=1 Tax=Oppia nitens TaxID=1686743 RepID=UPI0023DBC8B9|nr:peptide methionine sulfoxide reductase-like [Oppia nitens]
MWLPRERPLHCHDFGFPKHMIRTRVGYTGGTTISPTYHRLGDHTETIDIEFDPNVTTYEKLLNLFWTNHSPTVCHKRQYMSAIFYHNDNQKQLAEKSVQETQKLYSKPIQTKILLLDVFYEAEDYHQKYMLRKHNDLLKSLSLSDKQLIRSHIASRINGYLGNFGSIKQFEDESINWGLTDHQMNYIREQIKNY